MCMFVCMHAFMCLCVLCLRVCLTCRMILAPFLASLLSCTSHIYTCISRFHTHTHTHTHTHCGTHTRAHSSFFVFLWQKHTETGFAHMHTMLALDKREIKIRTPTCLLYVSCGSLTTSEHIWSYSDTPAERASAHRTTHVNKCSVIYWLQLLFIWTREEKFSAWMNLLVPRFKPGGPKFWMNLLISRFIQDEPDSAWARFFLLSIHVFRTNEF